MSIIFFINDIRLKVKINYKFNWSVVYRFSFLENVLSSYRQNRFHISVCPHPAQAPTMNAQEKLPI